MSGGTEDVDVARFRLAVDRFVTGVCVVSTRRGSQDHAITVTSFTWVSKEPPLVLACVHQDARFLDALLDTGSWGVSVLAEHARPAADWLATPGRPVVDQLARVPHHRGPVTGAALLTEAVATLECRTEDTYDAGDHVVVVGRVLAAELAEHRDPLVHHRGDYAALRAPGASR